jgi:glycosyltransferase involved in cell wall biosynthesis
MSPGRQSLVCVTTSAAMGGAETSLLTLLAAMRKAQPGWAMSVVTPASGPLLDKVQAIGVPAVALPYPDALTALGETEVTGSRRRSSKVRFVGQGLRAALTLPQYVTALRRELRGRNATVVHSNGLKAHVSAALAKPAGVRLVWQLHDYVQSRPLSAMLLRRLSHRADAVVANSDSVLADASAALAGHRDLRRIYNAVDLSRFGPDGSVLNLAALSGLPEEAGRVRIGLVATLARWKGHDVFIDAIAKLPRRDRIRAYIVGGAVYETAGSQRSLEELRRDVAERGLSDVVGFTGHVDDVPGAMRALDIVVHASTAPEPFGMVIAEGMASGRAVVAARAGGAAELFEDCVTAIGYRSGDAGELAERLNGLVSDASRRLTIGAAARLAAARRFAPERMAAEFREVYEG